MRRCASTRGPSRTTTPPSYDEAAAAELGYDSLLAPLTFVSILALLVQQDFFRNVDVGFETMQIVQVDQQFIYHEPIRVGDRLYARFEVDLGFRAVRRGHRRHPQRLTNERGEVVLEASTTLMGQEGEASTKIKLDAGTGQVTARCRGLAVRTFPDVHSDLGVSPRIKRAVRRFAD